MSQVVNKLRSFVRTHFCYSSLVECSGNVALFFSFPSSLGWSYKVGQWWVLWHPYTYMSVFPLLTLGQSLPLHFYIIALQDVARFLCAFIRFMENPSSMTVLHVAVFLAILFGWALFFPVLLHSIRFVVRFIYLGRVEPKVVVDFCFRCDANSWPLVVVFLFSHFHDIKKD